MNYSIELNDSCEEARLFGKQVLSDNVEIVLRYLVLIYYCLLFPFSLTLTLFIIFLIIKFKHLRDTTFMLALQVVILDFVFTITLTPVAVNSTPSGQWLLGNIMCEIFVANFGLIFLFRNFLMFIFVFDRFCNVFRPFQYGRHRKKVILTLWLFFLVLTLISITLF